MSVSNIELRWLIKERKYTTWDDRWDKAIEHCRSSSPILQYKNKSGSWKDVPIVQEIIDGKS